MLTFRRFTVMFFCCLLALNLISIFFCDMAGNILCGHMAALYFWTIGLYFGTSFLLAFFPRTEFHHPVRSGGKKEGNGVALTFDDGPDPGNTPRILEVLGKCRVPATFFCTGNRAEARPELLKQMVCEGHLIGNHSWDHSRWFDFYPLRKMRRDIQETNSLIHSLTGKKPLFFRPPFGVINPMLSKALRGTRMTVVAWTIRSFDTVRKDHNKTLDRILRRIGPGSIILLHDHSSFTSECLEILITRIRELNYEIKPLDKLLDLNPYE